MDDNTCWRIQIILSLLVGGAYIVRAIVEANRRMDAIFAHRNDWGWDICTKLEKRKITQGMTEEMVELSLGTPTTIETKEITPTGDVTLWFYGERGLLRHTVWFTNGVVTKIVKTPWSSLPR